MPKTPNANNFNLNFWGAITAIAVASMDKGQAPFFVGAGVLVYLISRMPASEITPFANHLVEVLERGHIIGYIIAILVTMAWYAHVRWIRKQIAGELREMAQERDRSQELAGVAVESSTSKTGRRTKREKK